MESALSRRSGPLRSESTWSQRLRSGANRSGAMPGGAARSGSLRRAPARSTSLHLAPPRSTSLHLAPPWSERSRVGAAVRGAGAVKVPSNTCLEIADPKPSLHRELP